MTNQIINVKVNEAILKSKKHGIAYLMSNGEEIMVVVSDMMKSCNENHFGFWTAMIFENGHIVEA